MAAAQAPARRGVTVLLVDDQPIIGEAVRRMLSGEEGVTFHYCKDAPAALEAAASVGPTVILQDLVMPEMDGIELARRATELDPDIKVMFITGFAAVALNPDNNAPKEAKVLSKPFHLKDLVSEVQRLLAA